MRKRLILVATIIFGAAAAVILATLSTHNDQAKPLPSVSSPPPDIPTLLAKAEKGEAEAQFSLAAAFAKGQGTTNSYHEAARWYRRAADQGHAGAQASLGELYEAGQGVPQDMKEALKLYRTAAEHGDAGAQYTLGFLYEAGRGLPRDQGQAVKWYTLAAEQGQPIAQYDLGQRYDLGVGVPVDRVEALKWLMLAAAHGQTDAAARINAVKKNLTRAQISEAERRVAGFSPGHPSSIGPKQ
jgi:TPR repeat protein